MRDELDDLRGAWQDQTRDDRRFTPDELAAAGARIERTVRGRNLRELIAGALVIPCFAAIAVLGGDAVTQLGGGLVALGTLVVLATIWRRGRTGPRPADLAADGLTWQIAELTGERDLLRSVPRWYLGPLVPGMIVLLWGHARGVSSPFEALVLAGVALVQVGVFGGVAALNHRASRELDARLAELRR